MHKNSLRHIGSEYNYDKREKVQKSWTALRRLKFHPLSFQPEIKAYLVPEALHELIQAVLWPVYLIPMETGSSSLSCQWNMMLLSDKERNEGVKEDSSLGISPHFKTCYLLGLVTNETEEWLAHTAVFISSNRQLRSGKSAICVAGCCRSISFYMKRGCSWPLRLGL